MDLILSNLVPNASAVPEMIDRALALLLTPGGLIACGAVLLLIVILAVKGIHDGNEFRKWKKRLEEKGWPERIKSSLADAEFVYSYRPGKRTLRYIRKLNPEAAKRIRSGTAKK